MLRRRLLKRNNQVSYCLTAGPPANKHPAKPNLSLSTSHYHPPPPRSSPPPPPFLHHSVCRASPGSGNGSWVMVSSLSPSLSFFLSTSSGVPGGGWKHLEDSCLSYCFFKCLQADSGQIGLVHSTVFVPVVLKGSICGFRMNLLNKHSSLRPG